MFKERLCPGEKRGQILPQDTMGLSKGLLKRHGALGVRKQEQELAKKKFRQVTASHLQSTVSDFPIIRCG